MGDTGESQKRKRGRGGNSQLPPPKKRDARLAWPIWQERKDLFGLTQGKIAERWGFHHTTVSQVLRGHADFSDYWKLRIADALRLLPQDIWPDWPFRIETNGRLSGREYRVVLYMRECNDEQRLIEIEDFARCKALEKASSPAGLPVQGSPPIDGR